MITENELAFARFIPCYTNDVEDPQGGVRGVIPERRKYLLKKELR